MLLSALALFAAQAASSASIPAADQARLKMCLEKVQKDPAAGVKLANDWLAHAHQQGRAPAQQCLGQAYAALQRWNDAHDAFLAARDASVSSDYGTRARLGAMAGNAAMAGKDALTALGELQKAEADASLAGDKALAGSIGADEARALVALGRTDEAMKALDLARSNAPKDAEVWLLSATLARRTGELKAAQAQIETAAALAPRDPAIGLEAGVIAELAGDEAAARKSWQAVIALAPDAPEAASAKAYLAQIGGGG